MREINWPRAIVAILLFLVVWFGTPLHTQGGVGGILLAFVMGTFCRVVVDTIADRRG